MAFPSRSTSSFSNVPSAEDLFDHIGVDLTRLRPDTCQSPGAAGGLDAGHERGVGATQLGAQSNHVRGLNCEQEMEMVLTARARATLVAVLTSG